MQIVINRVVPLCSAQYERQFNTTRVPGIEKGQGEHRLVHLGMLEQSLYRCFTCSVYVDDVTFLIVLVNHFRMMMFAMFFSFGACPSIHLSTPYLSAMQTQSAVVALTIRGFLVGILHSIQLSRGNSREAKRPS